MKKTVSDFLFDWHIVFLYIGFVFGSGWRFYSIEHDAVLEKNHKKFESDERFNIILGEKFKLLIYYLIFGRSTILGIPIALLIFHYLPRNFFNWIYNSYLNDFGPMFFFFFALIAFLISGAFTVICLGLITFVLEEIEYRFKIYKLFFPDAKGGWKYIVRVYDEIQEKKDSK